MEPLPKGLADILACPVCKSDLDYTKNWLKCRKCNKLYPIKNGIPILSPDAGVA